MEIKIEDVDMKNTRFVYFVHGFVPEFIPGTAFRREKHFKTAHKKIIKCPYCRKTFTTVDEDEKIELYCHSKKATVIYHKEMPCKTCNKIVGIVYASALNPAPVLA